jgi:hypothetical protein
VVKEKKMNDNNVLYMLYQTVNEANFKKITITTTTKDMRRTRECVQKYGPSKTNQTSELEG